MGAELKGGVAEERREGIPMISESCLAGGGAFKESPLEAQVMAQQGLLSVAPSCQRRSQTDGDMGSMRSHAAYFWTGREAGAADPSWLQQSRLRAPCRPAAAAAADRLEPSLPLFWLFFSHSIRLFVVPSCGCGFYWGLVGD